MKTCPRCLTEKAHSDFLPKSGRAKKLRPYCRPCTSAVSVESHDRRRQRALDMLGGCCVRCGFTDSRALQFDHVAGDGADDRRAWGRTDPNKVELEIVAGSTRFQILCANCNWIKRHEQKEYGRAVHV